MSKYDEKLRKALLQVIRRKNLTNLVARFDTQDKFAQAVELPGGSYVSRILKNKNIGDTVARRIEIALSLSPGALDREEGDAVPAYVWPFTLTSLDSVRSLKPQDLMVIDAGISAQIAAMQRLDAPRKKPGGGGGRGGGVQGGGETDLGSAGGGGIGSTKHAPLTLVRLSAQEQRDADVLAAQRAITPTRRRVKPRIVESPAENLTLFEK